MSLFFGASWLLSQGSLSSSAQQAGDSQPIPVQLIAVEATTLTETSEYIAQADARQAAALYPQAEGYLDKIYVQPGQQVAKGQVLFQLDARRQRARLRTAKAAQSVARLQVVSARENLAALKAQLKQAQARLTYAQQEFDRRQALVNTDAVSRQDFERASSELKQAQAAVEQLEQQINGQQAQIAGAKETLEQVKANEQLEAAELDYFTVQAPFAGTVGDVPVREGESIQTDTLLTTVSNLSPIQLELALPADKLYRLKTGEPLELLDEAGKAFGKARITFISPTVDPMSQTALVRASYANPERRVRDDQRVPVKVVWSSQKQVAVPTKAVQRMNGGAYVYVAQVEAGKVAENRPYPIRQQMLDLGTLHKSAYAVKEGLKPGDVIVVEGMQKIQQPNTKVMQLGKAPSKNQQGKRHG